MLDQTFWVERSTTSFALFKNFFIIVVECRRIVFIHSVTLEFLPRLNLDVIHSSRSLRHWSSLMLGLVALLSYPFLLALRDMNGNRS